MDGAGSRHLPEQGLLRRAYEPNPVIAPSILAAVGRLMGTIGREPQSHAKSMSRAKPAAFAWCRQKYSDGCSKRG